MLDSQYNLFTFKFVSFPCFTALGHPKRHKLYRMSFQKGDLWQINWDCLFAGMVWPKMHPMSELPGTEGLKGPKEGRKKENVPSWWFTPEKWMPPLPCAHGCISCPVPINGHLPLFPCSLQQTTSSSNSCVEGQSFLSYHTKEIPACSAVDYVRQHVIHSQQVMTLIHSLDWICSQ